MRIFFAGASGVLGRHLIPLLLAEGHTVAGMTRTADHARQIEAAGASPVLCDVYDRGALHVEVKSFRPDLVLHELTDLPDDPSEIRARAAANNRIRTEGTTNLLDAMRASGATRFIAQSIAWAYEAGTPPYSEASPLNRKAVGNSAITVRGVLALEETVLTAFPRQAVILRYGSLYGPETANAMPNGPSRVHVDAAALAASLAVEAGSGIYNIADPNGEVSVVRAERDLRWEPNFRQAEGRGERLAGASPISVAERG